MNKDFIRLATDEEYAKVRNAGSVHPCEVEGCVLSQEEHHRLIYGVMAENRDLKQRIKMLEAGHVEPEPGG